MQHESLCRNIVHNFLYLRPFNKRFTAIECDDWIGVLFQEIVQSIGGETQGNGHHLRIGFLTAICALKVAALSGHQMILHNFLIYSICLNIYIRYIGRNPRLITTTYYYWKSIERNLLESNALRHLMIVSKAREKSFLIDNLSFNLFQVKWA